MTLLETLNVFGIRADYIQTFKEFLENEGVPASSGEIVQIKLSTIKNKNALQKKLKTFMLPDALDYKKYTPKQTLTRKEGIMVVHDCYAQMQQTSSADGGDSTAQKDEARFSKAMLQIFDYDKIWLELERYKNEKNDATSISQKAN